MISSESAGDEVGDEKKMEYLMAVPKTQFKDYQTKRGNFKLKIDFAGYFEDEEFNVKHQKEFNQFEYDEWEKLVRKPSFTILIEAQTAEESHLDASSNLAKHILEIYLYDLYLTMNISFPGILDLSNVKYFCEGFEETSSIDLDTHFLNYCRMDLEKMGLPVFQEIPFQLSDIWLGKLAIGVKQIAESRLEQALFSFLNFSSSHQLAPVEIMWLVNCIETLYKTRIGENFTSSLNRITSFLQIKGENFTVFKKKLRDFYDFRSAFVHGGYSVPHPANNDLFDENYDQNSIDIQNRLLFGLGIVMCTFQRMVTTGIREIEFVEIGNHLPI